MLYLPGVTFSSTGAASFRGFSWWELGVDQLPREIIFWACLGPVFLVQICILSSPSSSYCHYCHCHPAERWCQPSRLTEPLRSCRQQKAGCGLRLCSDPMASLRKPTWWLLLFVWFLLGDFLKVLPHWPFPPSLPLWGFASWAIRTTETEVRVLLGSWHTVLNQVKRMRLGTTSWRQRRSRCSLEYVLFRLQTPVCITILFLLSFKW